MAAIPKIYLRNKVSKDGKCQLILKYSFNGYRFEYYCGISIKPSDYIPEYWKSRKKPIKTTAPNGVNFNNTLADIKADLLKLIADTKGENLNPTYIKEKLEFIYRNKSEQTSTIPKEELSFIKFFEKAIEDSKKGIRVMKKPSHKAGQRYSDRAIKNYNVSLSALKRYQKFRGYKDLLFDDINEEFYNSFRDYCFNTEEKEKATFAGYIKDIKTLMSEAGKKSQTVDFIKPTYEANTIALTATQVQAISDLDLSDSSNQYTDDKGKKISYSTLSLAKDLFLIGAYTGLRYSDFSKLDRKNIEGNFIRLIQQKTGGRVTIPIMSNLKPVLAKYPENLPSMSNQKFNEYIKHVAKLTGLTETITTTNTRGNKTNTSKAQLYKLISSHCCRRTYATTMYKAGVSPLLIMAATGHKTETSFLKYIRVNNEERAKLLEEQLKKLGL